MPSLDNFSKQEWIKQWEMGYDHFPGSKGFLAPKVAQFKEFKTFYYLSPFRILVFETIKGSGFPMCDSFYCRQCWEYEQVCLTKEPPLSRKDIAVNMKVHFMMYFTKNLWGIEKLLW